MPRIMMVALPWPQPPLLLSLCVVATLQAATHADLERIRLETTETYEREARLLREMRDQAVEEAGRLRIAHAELKVQPLH